MAVVHLLEPVEIHEQNRICPPRPSRPKLGVVEPFPEQDAVRQPGEGIVQGVLP